MRKYLLVTPLGISMVVACPSTTGRLMPAVCACESVQNYEEVISHGSRKQWLCKW